MYPVFALGPAASDRWPGRPDAVEAELADLDEHEVEDDHDRERGEEAGGERDESEDVGEWGEGQQDADRHADHGGECEWGAGCAVEERDAVGADGEDDQALGIRRSSRGLAGP